MGKTEVAKVLAAITGGEPDPAPVLRGSRRRPGPLRVGLRPSDDGDPPPRGPRRGSQRHSARHHEPGLPDRPATAPGDRVECGRASAGAAHRRVGPGRRGVRGLSPRTALRFPGHHPRDRDHRRRGAADRGPHLQPDPGDPRRPETALHLSLDRLPDPGPGGRHHQTQGPRVGGRSRRRHHRGDATTAPRWSCSSRPGSPKRSTGRSRCVCSAPESCTVPTIERTLGVVLKYKDDIDMVTEAGVDTLVG